ncbi:hypothetical protein D3C84_1318560 [compost metagenome]
MLGPLKVQFREDRTENLRSHLGIVKRPVGGAGGLKLKQCHRTFDADVIAESACAQHPF